MLDINLIRENPEVLRKDLRKRDDKEKVDWVDKLLDLDKKWRALKVDVEKLRNQRNVVSREIAQLKKQGKDAKAKKST